MITRLRQISIPILAKITVPYVFMSILIALGGTYLVTNVVVDTVEERFTNQIVEAGLLANEAMVRIEEDLLEDLRLLSFSGGMAAAVEGRQAATVNSLSLPAAYSADMQAFAFLTAGGQVVTSLRLEADQQVYVPLAFEGLVRQLNFVAKVLSRQTDEAGDKFSGFIRTDMGDYFFVAGPIENESGRLAGVALVGKPVADMVTVIRQETLAQVTLYTLDGSPLTSTLTQTNPILPDQASLVVAQQDQGSLARDLEDNAIDYREILTVWEVRNRQDVGIMGIALPTTFITQTNQITRTNVVLLMGAAMLMVLLIGMAVAGAITRPIHALRDAAGLVSKGNLSIRVLPSSRDELAELTVSFNKMVESLGQSKRDQLDTYDKTIEGWSRALDLRDHETEGHSQRVASMAVELAHQMGLAPEEVEHVRRGALLHDIGKIAIPDTVLLKKGALTESERELINQHPRYARQFMEQVEFLKPALDIPYSHHERWDGSGYPEGLRAEEIPMAARIFAVVDVWDAITSDRPYRRAMTRGEALALISQERGKHFDPDVLDVFVELLGEKDW